MRVEGWNPNKFDESFESIAMSRLVQAGEVIAAKARALMPPGKTERPVYKTGKYAGRAWTSRKPGRLQKSIRVRRKLTKSGKAFSRKRNVRVYAGDPRKWVDYGDYLAYYGAIREYKKPFLKPAFYASMPEIKAILGVR